MISHSSSKKALVLTVGTGNIDELEKTLLVPMLKSVEEGEWARIVLLPSHTTKEYAQTLQKRITNRAVEIDPLREAGQENDADACFGHFDAVLVRLIEDAFKPSDIVVDFTRGTKAMSAALVLAAIGLDIPALRYVHSQQRDERGTVRPGTEKVGQIETNLATARRRLDQAEGLMVHGDFGAVLELLPDPNFPAAFRPTASALRSAAQIYAAWDRLDYREAREALNRHKTTASEAGKFAPTEAMDQQLEELACQPDRSDHHQMAAYLRILVCDLLPNAERRLRDRHFEDALIRAYRVLELIGQIRLFDRGYDSAYLPPNDCKIVKFRNKLRRKSNDLSEDSNGNLTASKEQVARLLKALGDDLAQHLLRFDDQHDEVKSRQRNVSVLIHGFTATDSDETSLRNVLEDLEKLLCEDDRKAADRLKVSRSLNFG